MHRLLAAAAILAGGFATAPASAAGTAFMPGAKAGYAALNPQPLPPEPPPGQMLLNPRLQNPGTPGGINPQPLPPGGLPNRFLRR